MYLYLYLSTDYEYVHYLCTYKYLKVLFQVPQVLIYIIIPAAVNRLYLVPAGKGKWPVINMLCMEKELLAVSASSAPVERLSV